MRLQGETKEGDKLNPPDLQKLDVSWEKVKIIYDRKVTTVTIKI
jgi:hypothetical protein